jgi:hypothetical protein
LLGQRSHHSDAVLRMAHLHTDMELVDVHVAFEVCEVLRIADCEQTLTTKDTKNTEKIKLRDLCDLGVKRS